MTRAGHRLVVLGAVLATGAGLSSCKVLHKADAAGASTTAAGNALDLPAGGDPADCPIGAAVVDAALGGTWKVSSLPSGGCNYTHGNRTILVSTLPLPKQAAGRRAALDRARHPCDAGSARMLGGDAFVCRQDALLEAATIAGDRLLVLCTAAGPDAAQVPAIQNQLGTLVAAAATG